MKLRSRSVIFVAIAMLVLFYLAESSSSLSFASSSTVPSGCSGGWYITGYFNPREVDYPGHLVSVKVQGVGKVMLSDNFMKHQNIEGMGLTRFGWWLAGQNEKDYRKVPYPEDGMNPPGILRVGYSIATDPKKIPLRNQSNDTYSSISMGFLYLHCIRYRRVCKRKSRYCWKTHRHLRRKWITSSANSP